MKKFMTALLASILCVFTLTACAGGENEETTAANTEETVSRTAENTADETQETGGVLVVGTNAEFPPFEYIGDDGEPDGFDIALIKAAAEKMGMEVQVENMEFDSLVLAIGTKIDVAIAGMTVIPEREESVDFSEPYYTAVQYIITTPEAGITTAADLENKKVGVQLGTTGDFIAQDDIAGTQVTAYNKAVDAVNDLINGKVDYVIVDKNPAMVFESKFEGQVIALDGADFGFEPEDYAIAIPKGNTELAEKINAALTQLKEDGTFDALVSEYIEN